VSGPKLGDVLDGAVGAAGMVLAFFTPFLRAHRDHWGLSPDLAARPLPGDGLAGPDAYAWTHGIEIDAPAERVWPWVAQIGQGRAGFYSYELLENLVGCAIHNADEVRPEWQTLAVGDGLRLHPDVPPFPVVEVVSGRHFVVGGEMTPPGGAPVEAGSAPRVSWLFLVEPVDALRCRFISRFRIDPGSDAPATLEPWLLEPIGFVMDRRMLLGVRERAERALHAPSLAQVGALDLAGRVCLVTGANRGIGRATAQWLALAGARVGLLCRDVAAAETARSELVALAGRDAAFVVEVDLSDMSSVVAAGARVLELCPRLDAIVHNAGEYRLERAVTADGFERMLAVGYLGPWLLTALLRARLVESAPARVIVTAGIYHRRGELALDDMQLERRPWDAMRANNQLQLARATFAIELSRQLASSRVTVNAVHPGAVRTHAQDVLTGWQRALVDTLGRFVFADPEQGALPNLKLTGEAALAEVTGRYFDQLRESEASASARDPEQGAALWRWTESVLAPWLP
jgi:retinol dehydrogenase-14